MYIPIYLQVYRYVFSILRIENTNIALIFDQCIIRDIEDISIQACQQACYIGSTYANMCYWIAQQSCGIPCSAEIYLCKSTQTIHASNKGCMKCITKLCLATDLSLHQDKQHSYRLVSNRYRYLITDLVEDKHLQSLKVYHTQVIPTLR